MGQPDLYKNISVIYIAINKCANTSFKKILTKYSHIIIPHNNLKNENLTYNLHYICELPIWNSCFKFTVIRNPIDRFISSINFFCDFCLINNEKSSVDYVLNIISNDQYDYDLYGGHHSFIKRHTLPMSHNHYRIIKNDQLNIDYIFRLENLDKEYKNLCQKIFIEHEPLPKLNQSKPMFTKDMLNNSQISRICEIYRRDFEFFGYEP
jgi:hypothetical protein